MSWFINVFSIFIVSSWYFSLWVGFSDVVSSKFDLNLFCSSSVFINDILPLFIWLKKPNGSLNLIKLIGEVEPLKW